MDQAFCLDQSFDSRSRDRRLIVSFAKMLGQRRRQIDMRGNANEPILIDK
jgi:hypothetical protein